MSYFLWGCRGILTLITLRSERVIGMISQNYRGLNNVMPRQFENIWGQAQLRVQRQSLLTIPRQYWAPPSRNAHPFQGIKLSGVHSQKRYAPKNTKTNSTTISKLLMLDSVISCAASPCRTAIVTIASYVRGWRNRVFTYAVVPASRIELIK